MTVRKYIKQAFELLKQNPLFSTLYIVGTGLAIGMTMIVAMIYYVKLAPVYPEENRWHTLYLTNLQCRNSESTWQSGFSYQALQDWALQMEHCEVATAGYKSWHSTQAYIQPADRSGDFMPVTKLVDDNFFRIFRFRFLEGKPLTGADVQSGLRNAVITDDLARRLFGTTEGVVGRTFSLDYVETRVCGVVKSGSALTEKSYAQVYLPYSIMDDYRKPQADMFPYIGPFEVTYLVKDGAQADALRAELNDVVNRLNQEHKGQWEMNIWEQPTSHLLSVFKTNVSREFDVWATARYFLLMVLVLLLVPALNLSGMIAGRMESRLAEMGVRKSFGATRRVLLGQVMWENLTLTLAGGVLGLVVSWVFVYLCRGWVFSLLDEYPAYIVPGSNVYVSGEMLFAPLVFLCAFLLCVVLNMLSALLPAWMSLRKPIVFSLYEKR